MERSFLGEGWTLFKRTGKAAGILWGLYLVVVGVPGVWSMVPAFRALSRGATPPSAPGPLFFVAFALNLVLMPAVFWATMLIGSAPGVGEEPKVLPSLQEGFRHWGSALGVGLLVLVASAVPTVLLGWLLKALGSVGSLLQGVYSGVVVLYAQFAMLNLIHIPGTGVTDAAKDALRLIPKTQWLRTAGVLIGLGQGAPLLFGLLAAALFGLAGMPARPQGPAVPTPAAFWWVMAVSVPAMLFTWYQTLCAVSLWWRFHGLKAVTGIAPDQL